MTAPLRRVAVRGLPTHADYARRRLGADCRTCDLRRRAARRPGRGRSRRPERRSTCCCPPRDSPTPASPTTRSSSPDAGWWCCVRPSPCRSAEPPLLASELAGLGVPEVGRLTGDARADGGDLFWLDDHTLAAGRSYRTNAAAHAQLRGTARARRACEVLSFDLPHAPRARRGAAPDVGHQPGRARPGGGLRADRAVAAARSAHRARDRWIPVSGEEYAALGSNILATGPGRVIVFAGAPNVERALRDAGVDVTVARRLRVRRRRRRPHLPHPPPPPRRRRPTPRRADEVRPTQVERPQVERRTLQRAPGTGELCAPVGASGVRSIGVRSTGVRSTGVPARRYRTPQRRRARTRRVRATSRVSPIETFSRGAWASSAAPGPYCRVGMPPRPSSSRRSLP